MNNLKNNNFANVIKFTATAATVVMLAISAISSPHAEETVDFKDVYDGADGRYSDCRLTEGSTTSETSGSWSCTTAGGTTTECEKSKVGDDDQCVTVESGGGRPGRSLSPSASRISKGNLQVQSSAGTGHPKRGHVTVLK